MQDVIFGLVAIAAGALVCFRGHLAFRVATTRAGDGWW